MFKFSKTGLLATTAAVVMISAAAEAQVTSSSLRGTVTTASGAPVSGAEVTVLHVPTGTVSVSTTGAEGGYFASGLRVGGPYIITVTSSQGNYRAEEVYLELGETTRIDAVLQGARDEIVVVGTAVNTVPVAVGPSAVFTSEDLEYAPSINRNIADVIRNDPRIFVDESRGDINAVQCAGQNSRFNSLTVDGVRLNDSFGLNSNGYPTERMPFSYDAIDQVAVELAPFDVQYGGFTACNINAVTKSGTNEFHGGLFVDYSSNDLRGDSLEGDEITGGDYDEWRYGINVGGPIIQDKVFFFAAYEKLEGANLFDRGPQGSGAVNEILVTQAQLDEIVDIANNIYGYDPGGIPVSSPNEDEKILVKLDWNINANHRASFTYNWNDGFNIVQSDGDSNEFEFSNHLYERGAELNSYAGSLYSDWSDNFSTEFRLSYLELDNRQISVGGTDFGEIRIDTGDVDVYIGGDDSRQSNKLTYENLTFAGKGFYQWGDHNISFGYEREQLDVFNLFVQHSETEIRFRSIDDFRNGFASAIYYNNAPSQDPNDAAADWGYVVNTLYAQDEYEFDNGLSVVAGLRYDWYETEDAPAENADFVADYGFSNSQTVDGEGLLQPRFGFSWDVTDTVDLRGGVGLYSGGNPNVWLSNNYSANNVLQFGQRGRSFGYTNGTRSLLDPTTMYLGCEDGVPQGPGYCVPAELYNAVSNGVGDNFEINYLDPDFKIPSEWKFSLGATVIADVPLNNFLGGEYVLNGDILASKGQDSAIILRGDLEQVGTTGSPVGPIPVYDSVREPSFVLTNSDKGNTAFIWSVGLSKEYDNGFEYRVGYAYSDAQDVNPMTSSVAFSNYMNRSFTDPQEDVLARSAYNVEHRFTAAAQYRANFFGDYQSIFNVAGFYNEGLPYSYTYDNANGLYNFTPFIEGDPVLLYGEDRNGQDGSWWGKIDFRFEQELPGLRADDRASVFFVVDNLTNLINDEWGILRQRNFPGNVTQDRVGINEESRVGDASRWEIRFGAKYDF